MELSETRVSLRLAFSATEGSLKYTLVENGTLTQVRKKNDGRIMALKVISKRLASHWKGELVKREFELWRELNDRNQRFLVKMYYSYTTETTFNFVMEFVPGGTMLGLLRMRGKFDPQLAIIYFIELLLCLETFHQNQIVYRDIKAENVLLDEKGHIKLTDFGLARKMDDSERNENLSFCGSPIYIAPETLLKEPYNRKVDFYALGVLLYEMTVGHPPFNDKSAAEIRKMKLRSEASYPSNLDQRIKKILEKCLAMVSRVLLTKGPEGKNR